MQAVVLAKCMAEGHSMCRLLLVVECLHDREFTNIVMACFVGLIHAFGTGMVAHVLARITHLPICVPWIKATV